MDQENFSAMNPSKQYDFVTQRIKDSPSKTPAGTEWYIISKTWLDSLKESRSPGEISADEILMQPDEFVQNYDDSKSYENYIIRRDKTLDKDFYLVPRSIWDLLKNKYGAKYEILRYSISLNASQTTVEVTLRPILFTFIPAIGTADFKIHDSMTFYTSSVKTIHECKCRIKSAIFHLHDIKVAQSSQIRLWKLKSGQGIGQLREYMKTRSAKTKKDYRVDFPGTALVESAALSDTDLGINEVIIAELSTEDNYWRFIYSDPELLYLYKRSVMWSTCTQETFKPIKCKCGAMDFCSFVCQDDSLHDCDGLINLSQTIQQTAYSKLVQPEAKKPVSNKSSVLGLCGLKNIGNTCYMNSVLQWLSNTIPLTEYFLSNQYEQDINEDNVLGSGGKLAYEYAKLIGDLWNGSAKFLAPSSFKSSISRVASQFAGVQQQDAQEFLSAVLDTLHEDLNRVLQKPYIEEPEYTGQSDAEHAQNYYQNHLARNQSQIQDVFLGQYKSEVTCPFWSRHVKKFEPFILVNMQVPEEVDILVDVLFTFLDYSKQPIMMSFHIPENNTMLDLKNQIKEMLSLPDLQFVFTRLQDDHIIGLIQDDEEIQVVMEGRQFDINAYEIPGEIEDFTYTILSLSIPDRLSRIKPQAYDRLLLLPLYFTLSQIHERIYEYMSSSLYLTESKTFEQDFPRLLGNRGKDLYSLNLVNSNQENLRTRRNPCSYWGEAKWANCEMVYDTDIILRDILALTPQSHLFNIEIVWKSGILNQHDVHNLFNTWLEHESVDKAKSTENDISKRRITLMECIQADRRSKQLTPGNEWYCRTCTDHVRAFKSIEVYRLPQILILHIKRFEVVGGRLQKQLRFIDFPIEGLDLTEFSRDNTEAIYDLYGVVNHSGSINFGHYTAYCKNKGIWYEFDDARVTEIRNLSSIVTASAYILFYAKRI